MARNPRREEGHSPGKAVGTSIAKPASVGLVTTASFRRPKVGELYKT